MLAHDSDPAMDCVHVGQKGEVPAGQRGEVPAYLGVKLPGMHRDFRCGFRCTFFRFE